MRYLCLATDYDGTLATRGTVSDETFAALERLRRTGRRVLLVTGRELGDLQRVCPRLDVFDYIVAENGALLFRPASGEMKLLGPAPDPAFVDELKRRGVADISVGHVIVATWEPYESTLLETIRDLGLGLQVIFNKGAVMVLPSGITKATGLVAALKDLRLSRHNVVAVGDAENDHALLSACHCGVAVANAVPALKERADWVTRGDHGKGVEELIDRLLDDDLRWLDERLERHCVALGTLADGRILRINPFGPNVLVYGKQRTGKSIFAQNIVARLTEAGYRCCAVDPQGEHLHLESAVVLGSPDLPPDAHEVRELFHKSQQTVVLNLSAAGRDERPAVFAELFTHLMQLRAAGGMPHWLLIDEAHQVLPNRPGEAPLIQTEFEQTAFITTDLSALSANAMANIGLALFLGEDAAAALSQFCRHYGIEEPRVPDTPLAEGEGLLFHRKSRQLRRMRLSVPAGQSDMRLAAEDACVERY